MPLGPGRVGRAGVIGHPVAKTAVVAKAVSPGPSPVAKTAVVAAAVTPGRGDRSPQDLARRVRGGSPPATRPSRDVPSPVQCFGGEGAPAGAMVSGVVASALELSRWQFATTTLFHFIFVPITLGLAPLLAVMQTLAYRRPAEREKWLRLTRFFGVLFLINFAIGAATGLVQEFQFGMNWAVFSSFVGDVFGSPLAIEGLGAFMLESTFIGLWVFGRDRLSPRVHLADDLPGLARHLGVCVLHHRRQLVDAEPGRLPDQRGDRARGGDGHLPDPLPGVHRRRLRPRDSRGPDDRRLPRARGRRLAHAPAGATSS